MRYVKSALPILKIATSLSRQRNDNVTGTRRPGRAVSYRPTWLQILIDGESLESNPLSSNRAVWLRNTIQIRRCSFILSCFIIYYVFFIGQTAAAAVTSARTSQYLLAYNQLGSISRILLINANELYFHFDLNKVY